MAKKLRKKKPQDVTPEEKKERNEQTALFSSEEWWEKDWEGMPEYAQEDIMAFKSLLVHFDRVEDLQAFAKLVDQPINTTTKFMWYPKAAISRITDRRYVDRKKGGRSGTR